MHIRKKLLSGLVALFLLVGGSIVLTVTWMVLPGIAEVERNELGKEVNQVSYAIDGELDRLGSFALDWGEWDDTYRYIVEPNLAYETSNLLDATLGDVRTDLIVLINNEGRVIKQVLSPAVKALPALRLPVWGYDHVLFSLAQNQRHGLVLTSAGALLVAASPILQSDGSGPARGYVFFARLLDQEMEQRLAKELVLPIDIQISSHKLGESEVVFQDTNLSQITGYLPFYNRTDKTLQITLTHERPFYASTLDMVMVSLAMLIVIGTTATAFAYYLIRHSLVDPILTLKTQTELFKQSRSSRGILELKQGDELGELSRSFVEMLRELETSSNVLEQERQKLLDESLTDPLTRLGNRRFLHHFLNSRVAAGHSEWLFLMLDLDHFKRVNDHYGHDIGDLVLVEIANLLTDINRRNDVVARFGGEEFVVVCHNISQVAACRISERIRHAVESHVFHAELGSTFSVSCSVGFFVLKTTGSMVSSDWSSMLKVADLAMYAAKNSGRNTWVGLTPASADGIGEYPCTSSQVEQCISREHLIVMTCHQRSLHWQSPVESD